MGVSVKETTTTLVANTAAKIADASPGCELTIIANNGTGSMVWKCKPPGGSNPVSASDGTPLDLASGAGGQGGVVVLTGPDAIVDEIWGYSTAGTTVNVKQGTPR